MTFRVPAATLSLQKGGHNNHCIAMRRNQVKKGSSSTWGEAASSTHLKRVKLGAAARPCR